jgi:hypothetical protein
MRGFAMYFGIINYSFATYLRGVLPSTLVINNNALPNISARGVANGFGIICNRTDQLYEIK